ncbi:hypothetical protein [Streptomyces sp. NPDC020965]|uniref:hypothetical protein n=1 Tax=Streptomyces sp. NPDC020965 TaxID=3365105 RepID=UPI0037B6D98F
MRFPRHRLTAAAAGVLLAGAGLTAAPSAAAGTPVAAPAPVTNDWTCDTTTRVVYPWIGPVVTGRDNCVGVHGQPAGTGGAGTIHDRGTGKSYVCLQDVHTADAPALVTGARCVG